MITRPDRRACLAAVLALTAGVLGAQSYARIIAPFYALVARAIATAHPWAIDSVEVQPGKTALNTEVQLRGEVKQQRDDPRPSAHTVGRVDVGEVVETPIVFWTLLLAWPVNSQRQRLVRLALAVPIFLVLEAITTGTQLLLPMAQASAILAGDPNPVTPWDHWSRFLEAGGQFCLACATAIAVAVGGARLAAVAAAATAQRGSCE